MYLYYIMSWRSLSATNDTHKNSKLSAKKVIVKNIVISQETTLGNMDVSNLEYTRDDYSGNILTIEETLRGPDISLNRIKVLNQSDTSGVVKFVKPFVAPSAGLEGLRAYDGSFTTTKVSHDFQVGSVTKRSGDIIEILNDASFSNHISAPDVCANVIGSRNPDNGLPVYLSGDVSINEGLQCSDISVSHIHPLGGATKLLVNNDISASGAIYASDLSGFTFRALDVSVNDIYGANHHIDVVADISVNGEIHVTEISMNMLGGHNNRITIHNDLSVNGDLIVGEDLSLSNLFTTSDYIHFHNVTDISNAIKNLDISVGEIYPKELGNVRFVDSQGIKKETLIINGDVSFSGRVETDWVDSEFNVLDQVPSLATLISDTAKYPIGALLQVKGENSNQTDIFIKTNKESWYKLQSTNATPLFTRFDLSYEGSALLAGDLSGDITNTNTNTDGGNYFYYPTSEEYPDVSVGLQRYEEGGGFGDYDEVVFYVKKIKAEEGNLYFFDISASDSEADDISFSLLNNKFSDFSYHDGAGWELSLPAGNTNEKDISRIHVKVPINNGFDVSFIVRADDKISTFNDKIITIKKINEVPVWKHMVLEASNYQYIHDEGYDISSDASFNTEEWYSIYAPSQVPILPIDSSNNTDDVSYTFNVRYYNPARFNGDTSYYILDLSSLDPEGFDVCYEIQTANNDYLTHDWSWNLDGSKVYIIVPGEDKSNPEDLDFSFEIISHDNNIEDVSGFVPTDYYSFKREDVSKRIVKFQKINAQPEWNHIILSASNSELVSIDQSWNTTSTPSIGDLSNEFYLYLDSCKNYVYLDGITDLSHYYLDLSASDFEGFDVSYYVSNVNGDLSWAWVDNSRIVIDISDTAESGNSSSLQIISMDDWIDRPNPEKRIVKFKQISSEVIKLFDISENTVLSTTRNYNYSVNDYSFAYIRNYITIEPSYESIYSTYFDTNGDFSVNDITDNVEITIINNKIDVTLAGDRVDISFSFILNNIFKYNFNLTPARLFKYRDNYLFADGSYETAGFYFAKDLQRGKSKFAFIIPHNEVINCEIDRKPDTIEVWFFIASGSGGNGGAGRYRYRFVHARQRGGGGGGGASGFIQIKTVNYTYNEAIKSFKVNSFSTTNNQPRLTLNGNINIYGTTAKTGQNGGDAPGGGLASGGRGGPGGAQSYDDIPKLFNADRGEDGEDGGTNKDYGGDGGGGEGGVGGVGVGKDVTHDLFAGTDSYGSTGDGPRLKVGNTHTLAIGSAPIGGNGGKGSRPSNEYRSGGPQYQVTPTGYAGKAWENQMMIILLTYDNLYT